MENMTNWNNLFIRHGFLPYDLEEGTLSQWLTCTFILLQQSGKQLDTVSETEWMEALQKTAQNIVRRNNTIPGMESLIDPTKDELPLIQIDPYIRGIVRWLNMLHIYTVYSCDGHSQRAATIYFLEELSYEQISIIRACTPSNVKVKFEAKKAKFYYKHGEIDQLLTIAERLYAVWKNPEMLTAYRLEKLQARLFKLLSIRGSSGKEHAIRQFLYRQLRTSTDWLEIDAYGNLLASVHCGDGPTILLSAHMDTVYAFCPQREIIEDRTILKSSAGILGADDRAGIAVILELLDTIRYTHFKGTLKIAFTVEEEFGCRGARHIDPTFLQDVDAAIVVDRRGTRDIVTSWAGIVPFCSEDYGRIFEKAGEIAGMPDWKMTKGGSSDAKIFAEHGIPSVNLSVGYQNEHTDDETLDYKATLETIHLLETVFDRQLISKETKLAFH
jgi:tripeptide aminopeptidase